MSFEGTLAFARKRVQDAMTSHCVITRPSDPVFDDESGEYTAGVGTVIYSGKCRLKTVSPVGQRSGNQADRELTTVMYDVVLPYSDDAHGVGVSDQVVVDEGTVTYHVQNVDRSRDRTSTHIIVVDLDRGDVDYA